MINIINNICDIVARFLVKGLDWLLGLSRLSRISIEYFIKDSNNILNLRTHVFDKKYIDAMKINSFDVYCKICNIKIAEALYCEEDLSLSCNEQQIKNLIE